VVSLFGSLNVGELALRAQSVALQTTGQNIANASNETYHRQRVFMEALPGQDRINYHIGSGVQVERISRVIDVALETLLRDAQSGLSQLNVLRDTMIRLETVFNELSDADLSSVMENFWNAVNDFSANVEDSAARRSLVLAGESMSDSFKYFASSIRMARKEANEKALGAVDDINRIASEIAGLNKQIVIAEDGGLQSQTANDLRDRRDALVEELSKIISVKTVESKTGALQIYTGSEFLVYDTNVYKLAANERTDDGVVISDIVFEKNGMSFNPKGGSLKGLLEARDTVLPEYLSRLDTLAKTIIYEFNKIQSTGRGLEGYTSISGTNTVSDPAAALNSAMLAMSVQNGSFNIKVKNLTTGQETTTNVKVDLTGTGSDTTLIALAQALDAVAGVSARVTSDNRLEISSEDANTSFTFSSDTSGVLAALGAAAFFTGSDAESMGVSSLVSDNLNFVAGALSDNKGDNANALLMLGLRDTKVLGAGAETLDDYYQNLIGTLGTESASYQDLSENQKVLTDQMSNERKAISGVSIDEEAINLVQYQQAFQAAAKFVSVISQMMDVLMNM
jgi:flagellar hook-associated protein 1 FlgK